MLEHVPPHLAIALSVVSMELFAPYKIAEIRASHSNDAVPDPRYLGQNFDLAWSYHLVLLVDSKKLKCTILIHTKISGKKHNKE